MDTCNDIPLPGGKERDATCAKHGAFVSRHIIGRTWSHCPACQVERAETEAVEERRIAQREAERRALKELGTAAIPPRYIGRTFDTFRADDERKQKALAICRDFAENFGPRRAAGHGLVLTGGVGTGKSHLACAILQAVIGRKVLYSTCLDLIRMVRDTWRRDSPKSERQVLGELGALDLLAIDEVGVQYGTDAERMVLFDVLDLRYRNQRPTLLLTNLEPPELEKYLGERAYDRLRETARIVAFDWPSYRPQARREAAA